MGHMSLKRPLQSGDVLTTGQVARVCRVSNRTVQKWVDAGHLKGYRLPASQERRVRVEHVRAFLAANGMPAEWLDEFLAELAAKGGA